MNGVWLISYITLWILFFVVALVLLTVLRNLGAIYEILSKAAPSGFQPAPTKLKEGEVLPDVQGDVLQGQSLTLSRKVSGNTAVIVISPGCGPCRHLLSEVVAGRHQLDPMNAQVKDWFIVSLGEWVETQQFLRELEIPASYNDQVMIVSREKIMDLWGINTTPTTVIVDDHRRIVRQVFGA